MGILKETSKILDKTARILNEAAFGDIRNIFNRDFYAFIRRPIGLYQKSYDFMIEHLRRNIGNSDYVYDGYSTPIGEMSDPFYNTTNSVPWFYADYHKNITPNYLAYIRSVYGATLSVENINDGANFHISDDASAVGYVPGINTLEALANDIDLIPNVNGTYTDTRLGINSGYYNRKTLRNAVTTNNIRKSHGFSITSGINNYTGVNTENITDKKTYKHTVSKSTGRFSDDIFSPLKDAISPVYESNWGKSIDYMHGINGVYDDLYKLTGEKTKNYIKNNVLENKYYHYNDDYNTYFEYQEIIPSFEKNSEGKDVRYVFSKKDSNIKDNNGSVYVYEEINQKNSVPNISDSFNGGVRFGQYSSYSEGLTADDLLKKTNESFRNGTYKTIIARFHTDKVDTTDTTQTAISKVFGMSHGRNLLKTKGGWNDESEGYDNPYCRVWTFHHQYKTLNDAIRPFSGYSANDLYGRFNFNLFTSDNSDYGFENGRQRLETYGTLNKDNGLVNITPIDNASRKVDIKNCMFSIENLAWKDVFSTDNASRETFQSGGLSPEQKGPFGGRIMWFPPYGLEFNEDVSVNWSETNFIGRGESIYTYTNTTRSGNLKFKILVDHPSIINYWENRGKSNSNSVDEVDDPEQQLLRFFAGCDMLTGKPESIPEPVSATKDDAIKSPDTQTLKFFVFFPNNYSGVNDGATFATSYLTNGFGAGVTKDSKGNTVRYQIPYAKPIESPYGGYEMRPGKSISGYKAKECQNNEKEEFFDVEFNSGKVKLYTQNGNSTDEWWKRKWYYRVDDSLKDELLKKENYIDTSSSCLNSYAGLGKIIESFDINKNTENVYSFADIYVALEGGDSKSVLEGLYYEPVVKSFLNKINQYEIDHVDCIGRASNQGYDKSNKTLQINRARTIKNWLSTKKGFNANTIHVYYGGSGGIDVGVNTGDINSITNKLWRCVEVNIYLKESTSKTIQAAESETSTILSGEMHQNNIIGTPESIVAINAKTGISRTKYFSDLYANKYVEERVVKDKDTDTRLNNLGDNINSLALNLYESVRNGNTGSIEMFNALKNSVDSTRGVEGGKDNNSYVRNEMNDNSAKDEVAGYNNSVADKTDTYNTEAENTNNVKRYDNESKFFYLLERNAPFMHHKISDKIKYFDPAFHSISPEGFNARLTFLQQCTRQGPTIGNSDNGTERTANNLAFGRPPVCVLRIGDFYYTKIIIESISFSFDPLMWDLNSEGIGVMPMIADINMRFKFIGGSSLAGHITRLQNALSFNYYANTEVYDNRAEMVDYNSDGNISKFKPNPIIQ